MTTEQIEQTSNGTVTEDPEVIQWATLDAIRAAVANKKAQPTHAHTDLETGLTFEFKELTGEEMDRIASWAGGDEDKYAQLLAETASLNPKIDMLLWSEMGQLGPMVRVGILGFIRKTSKLTLQSLDDAKN